METAQINTIACVTVNLMFDLSLQLLVEVVQQDQKGRCYLRISRKTILLDRCVSIQYPYQESLVGLNTHTHTHVRTLTPWVMCLCEAVSYSLCSSNELLGFCFEYYCFNYWLIIAMIPFVYVIVTQFLSNAILYHQACKDVDIYSVFLKKEYKLIL